MGRWRWMNLFVAAWFLITLILFLYAIPTNFGGCSDKLSQTEDKLNAFQQDVKRLGRENSDLRDLLRKAQNQLESKGDAQSSGMDWARPDLSRALSRFVDGPPLEYELMRRHIKRDLDELWWFLRDNLEGVVRKPETPAELQTHLKGFVEDIQHREQAMQVALMNLAQVDGFEQWRKNEAKSLSDLVQKRIYTLQNPSDCQSAKKLLCSLNKGCGFGCQVHHAIYCFIVAYGTERMLVLKSKGWKYNKAGFEELYMPLSETCPKPSLEGKRSWPGTPDRLVVELGIVDSVNPRPEFLPPSIPKDLSERIILLHGDPIVWWVSQFLKYMLRPQRDLQQTLDESVESQGFSSPMVGIHVRRTDKVGTEAAFHGVDEYMKHVKEYFQLQEVRQGRPIVTKSVYVASDDPKVLAECQKNYPDFTFHGNPDIAKSAAVSSRYNKDSLKGIIIDIHLLAQADYLVCTFSSQVCRIAYEILQERFTDGADRFKSLDDIWYYGGQSEHQQIAIMDHTPKNRQEIELKKGDVIGVAGNHWNGFNKGRNHRTNRVGLYPSYKTKENIKIVDFPSYPHVEL
ncbi:hypothetical protein TCAL_10341 [Tigriopus californicus]|uniref:Alpha-(1,6)-fucosyltransferase n=1 Tax=Tigriopus californicus TaxID=6832 RepID=A0A553NBS8_TIGCA|nr:alpha-(1,6)-fucosyltransferase-like [Tigriopus californicus]TRY62878.1 hypothetical protein TCAL_10341 [Tigriopus californicus]|eukprot:TCALIF_10341-PA protein Name:"Similar to fut8 Alpha-(1,6)-fucosyltransferase (Xenopus tropicalis)" AED:0.25 eAED:0.25 QI:0/-1/0/1/-1/1/1/0/569